MKELNLRCKLIIPMFMTGSDKETPELRPTEFKGMMRWWWRAIKAEDNLQKLKKEEAEIFGSIEKSKSKVKIKIYIQHNNSHKEENIIDDDKSKSQLDDFYKGKNLKQEYNLKWEFNKKKQTLDGEDKGIAYLLYSTVLPGKERAYIKTEFNFNIEISSFDEDAFKQAVASLWTAINLGGFGTRARRGGGNIVVVSKVGEELLDSIPKGKNSTELANWIINNFKKAKTLITNYNSWAFSYSNLCFSRFVISENSFNSWKEALNDIGKQYLDFRIQHKNKIFDSAVFGLPVIHHGFKIEGSKTTRRSSPLIIKILLSEGKYWWMVIRLFGEFLQEEEVLVKKVKKEDKWQIEGTQKPTYTLIDEFWNKLKSKGEEFILNKPESLDKIVNKIRNELNPERIILFGSRARGDAHKNSDIDIALKTEHSIEKLSITGPFDIINLNRASPEIKEKIKKEGVILYERKS